jgi:outer membrane protein OmpA-like peptidoglycan-associated protein
MRSPIVLLVPLLASLTPASAQVTVDLRALDGLPGKSAATTRPPSQAARSRGQLSSVASATSGASRPAHAAPGSAAGSAGATAAGAGAAAAGTTALAAASPTAPTSATPTPGAPPPDASLPAGSPPPPTTLADNAAAPSSDAAPTMKSAAVRVMFGPNQTDLGADGTSVIKQLVGSAPSGDNTTFNVMAYAAATPNDPSAARRTSLSRAVAVRNALLADGVASTHIYVRALGGQAGDGPADRADITVMGSNAPPPGPAKQQ